MFTPVNRYIWIQIPPADPGEESLIVLPEGFKPPEERYVEVKAVCAASDIRFKVMPETSLIVDRSMIEQISIGGTIYNVILDNYVVGMIE